MRLRVRILFVDVLTLRRHRSGAWCRDVTRTRRSAIGFRPHRRPGGFRVRQFPDQWRLQFDSHKAIMAAAVNGMGVACLLDWLIRDHLEAKRLVPVLEDFPSPPVNTYAVWPSAQFVPPRLRVTIDALSKLQSATI